MSDRDQAWWDKALSDMRKDRDALRAKLDAADQAFREIKAILDNLQNNETH